MSRRHYVTLPDHSYKCVSCRQEFSTREKLGRHYSPRGKCRNPIAMGLHLDIQVSQYRWTSNKPESAPGWLSKAA